MEKDQPPPVQVVGGPSQMALFDWMVTQIHSGPMFLVLGVGTEIVALLALLAFFRRRGWF